MQATMTDPSPLRVWLEARLRDASELRFPVSDLVERCEPDVDIVRHLGHLVLKAKSNPETLRRLTDVLGWPDAAARLRPSRREGIRRGDFGEALTCELLEIFDGYVVPVRKLRYQSDPEQTLHGTDIVAFRITQDGAWYRGVQERYQGHIRAGGVDKDVDFVAVDDEELNQRIDAAYRAKYGRYGSRYVEPMTSGETRTTTLRLRPRAAKGVA
jgi:hypothetical protein